MISCFLLVLSVRLYLCLTIVRPTQMKSVTMEKLTKYLPPNVTALIQPMDQGVFNTLKLHYKKKLLHRLLIEDEQGGYAVDFLKSIDMKKVVQFVAEA